MACLIIQINWQINKQLSEQQLGPDDIMLWQIREIINLINLKFLVIWLQNIRFGFSYIGHIDSPHSFQLLDLPTNYFFLVENRQFGKVFYALPTVIQRGNHKVTGFKRLYYYNYYYFHYYNYYYWKYTERYWHSDSKIGGA
jgi:hypothetical protein